MAKQDSGREEILTAGENTYFAASNSKDGFCSFYPEVFDRKEIAHIYAIKGGPGTGKSRFMSEMVKKGEERGLGAEKILCSSDPNSLDGIILWKKGTGIAFVDATSPHVYEPHIPGVREEIINLGDYWNAKILQKSVEEIYRLNQKKASAYQQAYTFLQTVGKMMEYQSSVLETAVDFSKMEDAVQKNCREISKGKEFSQQIRIMRSVGMRGNILLNSYTALAEKVIFVKNDCAISHLFMKRIYEIAKERKEKIYISYHPILPERIDGIFFCKEKTAFVNANPFPCEKAYKSISCKSFLRCENIEKEKELLQLANKIEQNAMQGANLLFGKICETHFAIEKIYSNAMDFEKKEKFTQKFKF